MHCMNISSQKKKKKEILHEIPLEVSLELRSVAQRLARLYSSRLLLLISR